MLGQLRVLLPDVRRFGQADRRPHRLLHPAEVGDHLVHALLGAEQGLVADDHPDDVAVVFPVDLDELVDLLFVGGRVVADPGAKHHVQAVGRGQAGDLRERAVDTVAADRVGAAGEQGEVPVDLVHRGVDVLAGRLAGAEGREREPLDLGRPGRFEVGCVDHFPEKEGKAPHEQGDDETGTVHGGCCGFASSGGEAIVTDLGDDRRKFDTWFAPAGLVCRGKGGSASDRLDQGRRGGSIEQFPRRVKRLVVRPMNGRQEDIAPGQALSVPPRRGVARARGGGSAWRARRYFQEWISCCSRCRV